MSVAVIGAVFIDCKAFAYDGYNPIGRNIGKVKFIHGGVARNVAENIARLGCATKFSSCVDGSSLAASVVERLKDDGMDVSYVFHGSEMGIWSVILDEKGNQLGSVSQVPKTSDYERYFEGIADELVSSCNSIALELDYSYAITDIVLKSASKYGKKVYGVVANLGIFERIKNRLSDFELIICNDIEAGKIFGVDTDGLTPDKLIALIADRLDMYDLDKIIVTMGAIGSVYIEKNLENRIFVSSEKVTPIDTTGAGDAFFSGIVASLDKGLNMRQAMLVGTRLAAQTICVEENTCIPSSDIFDKL